jgi:hypothetical protein
MGENTLHRFGEEGLAVEHAHHYRYCWVRMISYKMGARRISSA